ncbi:MAG: putative secreted protein [Acidimicrobiales bacterium]|nr:putative secreted protein [Acidimicrobiales bacterium]
MDPFPTVRRWPRRSAIAVVAALSVLAACGCRPTAPSTLREGFDGTGLDSGVWHANRWFASLCAGGATSGEEQWYRPAAAKVTGGNLVITATVGANACGEGSWSGNRGYTSGWVQTGGARASARTAEPGFVFRYGRVDVRFRADAGDGLWPAIWLLAPGERRADGKLPYPSRPEIDIVEVHGDSPGRWRFHLHNTTDAGNVDPGASYDGPDTSTGFHTASVDWRADKITWLVDGVARWTYTGPGIPREPMYLVMNLAVGGWAGTPDPAAFPARMVVDSVKITA